MLAARIGTFRGAQIPLTLAKSCSRPPSVIHIQFRTYALSRFDSDRRPGVGRVRPKVTPNSSPRRSPLNPQEPSPTPEDQRPFETDENSTLWEASQRPPASNPEEGLNTLLMHNDLLVVTRQIEMLNIFVGFEQANRYVIMNAQEETLGYIAEEPRGFFSMFARQAFRTHRPFRAVVLDRDGSPVLWLRRPFAWINSRMYIQRLQDYETYTPEGEPVLDTFAEVQQRWHIWRRRYDLFLRHGTHRVLSLASDPQPEPEPNEDTFHQFAKIDEGFWAWDFSFVDAHGKERAHVSRNFRGFGREIFTDTGRYMVRFAPQPILVETPTGQVAEIPNPHGSSQKLTLDERALVLANAVNIDYDYFSRHSGGSSFGLFHFFSSGE
ncbi:hypothetical protein QCA50_003241 [Cerrena zonata]|uniref:Phospholipid scramblase n=1 Tax=Cerrena zonata TaxID=2478898 RepID=A0AAW0GLR2_9APHY